MPPSTINTEPAPPASARSTSARTTCGSVVAPLVDGLGVTRFGLMTTVRPVRSVGGHSPQALTARCVAAYGSLELPTPTLYVPLAAAGSPLSASAGCGAI